MNTIAEATPEQRNELHKSIIDFVHTARHMAEKHNDALAIETMEIYTKHPDVVTAAFIAGWGMAKGILKHG